MRTSKFFFNFNFLNSALSALTLLIAALAVLTACSLYQSGGREAIEKDSAGLVTGSGVNLALKTRYECRSLMALPADWQTGTTSLDEYATIETAKAVLLAGYETPTVVVYYWVDRHVEGCTLTVMDSKLSTQNLSDVVGFGEKLLTQSAGR